MLLFLLVYYCMGVDTCDYGLCNYSYDRYNSTLLLYDEDNCSDSHIEPKCTVTHLPPMFILDNEQLDMLSFPSCNISTLLWQSVYAPPTRSPSINIAHCPIDCKCENIWLMDSSAYIRLPEQYLCDRTLCQHGSLRINSTYIDTNIGEELTIRIDILAEISLNVQNRQYFRFSSMPHHFEEIINESTMILHIQNISMNELGIVTAICWHCKQPLHLTLQIRMPTPISVFLIEKKDSEDLVVYGYPLKNLTLRIDPVGRENEGIIQIMPTIGTTTKYWDSLIVKQVEKSFYRHVYSIYTRSCSECSFDHLSGNYTLTVCTLNQCTTVHNYIDHLGNQTSSPSVINKKTSDHRGISIMMTLCLIGLVLSAVSSVFIRRLHLLQKCRSKMNLMRKLTWTETSQTSRRASRATEETLLRLEERSSLSSSDYSNQIIPFIQMGNIKIHEKIGKGAFGEVYCGSWEKLGDRSVAVKSIPQADEDVEKEAIVLSRLDHANIVRLYGMTRDGGRLLLVFEMMNQGDLRNYLRTRAPQSSNYTQFPPALIDSELKKIVREIVSGVCYLVAQQIVHRDLAARNCLVQGDSDLRCSNASQRPSIRVKISDFGMSRHLYNQSDYYKMQRNSLLPVRWLPPEAISQHKFSHMSDIWSLGVTMWEVFSYGELPFADLSNHELVSYAMAGMRPPKPRHCSQAIYELMQECWSINPDDRISADEILLHPSLNDCQQNGPINHNIVGNSPNGQIANGHNHIQTNANTQILLSA